jgi:superfamily I DNA and/or RNA helicase
VENYKQLFDYYIQCIETEEINSLTFNIRDENRKFFTNFFEQEPFFHNNVENVSIDLKNKFHKNFFTKLTTNHHLFYGYPLNITNYGNISPLFFTELIFDINGDNVNLIKGSINPEFNHYILKNKGMNDEEINLVREEIDQYHDFQTKLKKIYSILGVNTELSVELSREKLFILRDSEYNIQNKSMIYLGEKTGYTGSLLYELNKLKKLPYNQLISTPLKYIFNPETLDNSKNKNNIKPLLNTFHLNPSQTEAVENAFLKKFTVITGPPGTGKSQVVLNIISNAIWNDKTILFASKNNRAVDVVFEKLMGIVPKSLIMRMGNRENRKNTKLALIDTLSNKEGLGEILDIRELQQKLEDNNLEIENIKFKIKELSEINNSIDEALIDLVRFSNILPDELMEIYTKQPLLLDRFEIENDINILTSKLPLFDKLIKWIFSYYFRNRNYKIFKKYYSKLDVQYTDYFEKNLRLNDADIIKFLNWLLIMIQIYNLEKEIKALKSKFKDYSSVLVYLKQIKKLEDNKVPISRDILKSHWLSKISKIQPNTKNDISRYFDTTENLGGYLPRDIYFAQISEQIKSFKQTTKFLPAWIVTNLSAKNSVPFSDNIFDLLVIDEASQCDIPSAIPLLFRAKNIIIIGDPKQLKHISNLNELSEKKIASDNNISEYYVDFSYCKNSIYDLCERTIKTNNESETFLNEHYRCHKDIITYSNKHFYGGKLQILTDDSALFSDKDVIPQGISWIDIKGKTQYGKSSCYNLEEVSEIITILKKICKNDRKISIGVVTFFKPQMDIISNEIRKAPELEKWDITVGTAHKFQGDEKDIIIFSPAISEGVKQRTLNWINTTKQLLNVSVTRAKSSLIIVGDFEKCENEKGFLKSLADYCKQIKDESEIVFDSEIENVLFDELRKRNVTVIPQYNVLVQNKINYRLDFALFVNNKKFDIEIDGSKKYGIKNRGDSENLRERHLREIEGWIIRRYPASFVQNNLEDVVNEISKLC